MSIDTFYTLQTAAYSMQTNWICMTNLLNKWHFIAYTTLITGILFSKSLCIRYSSNMSELSLDSDKRIANFEIVGI